MKLDQSLRRFQLLLLKNKPVIQQFVLNVLESESAFLAELLAKFEFVEIVQPAPKKRKKRTPDQQLFLDELKGSIHEMELHRQGKLALPIFEEMMAEV